MVDRCSDFVSQRLSAKEVIVKFMTSQKFSKVQTQERHSRRAEDALIKQLTYPLMKKSVQQFFQNECFLMAAIFFFQLTVQNYCWAQTMAQKCRHKSGIQEGQKMLKFYTLHNLLAMHVWPVSLSLFRRELLYLARQPNNKMIM